MKKKIYAMLSALLVAVMVSGCGNHTGEDIQILRNENDPYTITTTADKSMKEDKYYIKNNTKFSMVYNIKTNGAYSTGKADACAYVVGDYENLIPTYYKNELIARSSSSTAMEKLDVARYTDDDFSLGIVGAKYENGYIKLSASQNLVKGSNANEKLGDLRSSDILIEAINGIPVTEAFLTDYGTFTGLEKDAYYELTFYAGTYYSTTKIMADTHYFHGFEMYSLTDYGMTQNGYVYHKMPLDAKSGYYLIRGEGMYRYVDFERGEQDLAATDYNVPYYKTLDDQIMAYSQQYTFVLDTNVANASIKASFDTKNLSSSNVQMVVTAPNGIYEKTYGDIGAGTLEMDYSAMMAGKWTINIIPEDLKITSLDIVDNALEEDLSQNSYTFVLTEDHINTEFYVTYEGGGKINAVVADANGESYTLVKEDKYLRLSYTYPYLPAGTYTITVYHDTQTRVLDAQYKINTNQSEEIITIEG